MKTSIVEHMDLYQDVLFKSKIMKRKSTPLHRQVKNIYSKNRELQTESRALQEENKRLEEELQVVKSKVSKGNLTILTEAKKSSDD